MKFKLIIWIFALIFLLYIPISYPYGCPYIFNETFDSSDNVSLNGGCTVSSGGNGLLECSGANRWASILHALPNLSLTPQNTSIEFKISISSLVDTESGVKLQDENISATLISCTSTNCGFYSIIDRRGSSVNTASYSPTTVTYNIFAFDATWQTVRIDILTNGTQEVYVNGTFKHNIAAHNQRGNWTWLYFHHNSPSAHTASYDNLTIRNLSANCAAVPDTTSPEITYYNLTSSDNGCENWITNKNNPCSTSIVTPTVQFNTNENAWCAIAGSSSSTSLNLNYTDMGSSRNCTGAASGEGTTSHLCTLTNQDELVHDTSYLFISCKDANNNENRNSTSGPLKLSITGLKCKKVDDEEDKEKDKR